MPTNISSKDRNRAAQLANQQFIYPKTKIGRFLCTLAGMASTLASPRSTQYRSLSSLTDIQQAKDWKNEYKKQMNLIREMKRQRLIETERKGDELYLRLTDTGWHRFLSEKRYLSCRVLPENKWCLVSFDIPEDAKDLRALIRSELKRAEFEMVHKSLWRSKRDISKEFSEIIKPANSGKWVRIFVGEEINSSETANKA